MHQRQQNYHLKFRIGRIKYSKISNTTDLSNSGDQMAPEWLHIQIKREDKTDRQSCMLFHLKWI